jgi:hypothetical protein
VSGAVTQDPAPDSRTDDAAVADAAALSGTRPQDPPLLVAATVGDVTAVWQVEVDARVLLGDFSGAWLVDGDGVRGFAADADWIPQRGDRAAVLGVLLSHPVLTADGGATLPGAELIDIDATVTGVRDMVRRNHDDFAAANPGKRQPAWGAPEAIGYTPVDGPAPHGLDGDAAEAVTRCMAAARGLRGLVREWNRVEKLRAQRLGGDLRPLPVVLS